MCHWPFLLTDVGRKLSGEDLPDINANMALALSGVIMARSSRVALTHGTSDISGSGIIALNMIAMGIQMSSTFFMKNAATALLNDWWHSSFDLASLGGDE